jgi:RNA polymerase sigma-70 factor (ECF subfamily)
MNLVDFSQHVRECAVRIAESGPAALAGLFDLTSQRLVRFATTLTRNQHDAEDAVQAVLTRVALKPELLHLVDRPWPYLLQMVRNESLMILRKKRRFTQLPGISDFLISRVVDTIECEERHRAVWHALHELPSEQSEVVVLKIWENLTFVQIAEVLEITPSTAASRYRYAMQKLQGLLMWLEREGVVCA